MSWLCRNVPYLVACTIAAFCASTALAGTVITDGSLGPAHTLSGPNYAILPSLGQIRGGNLFQSFKTFDLSGGDIATFSGPSTVTNVLARVTGGQSNIDGTLACSIPHAAFYLINPSGVVFGPDAALEVKDSFVVTTADQVKLADGHVFGPPGASDATLTSVAPASFGFLAKHPSGLTINGALLRVPTGKQITIAGGTIQIGGGATVRAPRGMIGVLSVGGPTSATLAAGHSPVAPVSTQMGNVAIEQNSFLKTTSDGGGRIEVDANNLTLTDSAIDARTLGAINGSGIALQLTGTLQLSNSSIFTNTGGAGNAGGIRVKAANVDAINGLSGIVTGINARSLPNSTGDGGDVIIHATNLSLADGEEISTTTAGAGHGGSIVVIADRFAISGFSPDAAESPSGIRSIAISTGPAGSIRVHAGTLRIESGGVILSGSPGKGLGGAISITAHDLVVHGASEDNPTGIVGVGGSVSVRANSTSVMEAGSINSDTFGGRKGGDVSVQAASLSLTDGGDISSSTFSTGPAGSVAVSTDHLAIDGRESSDFTGIFSDDYTGGTGNGGSVTVHAASASIVSGGQIGGEAFGSGNGGEVTVDAGQLRVDGSGSEYLTGVISGSYGDGKGGTVSVRATSISLAVGGEISSNANARGSAGNVAVSTDQLAVDGRGSNFFTGILSADNTSGTGNGGLVTVHAASASIVAGGQIGGETFGSGNGGEVTVDAGQLSIDGSDGEFETGVVSTSQGNGKGGTVSVQATSISLGEGGEISSSTNARGSAGNVAVSTDQLAVDGRGSNFFTGILSADNTGGTGNGGLVTVHAASASIVSGGQIGGETFGSGNGGEVTLDAGQLKIDGRGSELFTGVDSDAGGTGAGGAVTLLGDSVSILDGGLVTAETFGSGHGGSVFVSVSSLLSDGYGAQGLATGLGASSRTGGAGGSISLEARSARFVSGSEIFSSASGSGSGGQINAYTSGDFIVNGGIINASAASGSGGSIFLSAGHGVFLKQTAVDATSQGPVGEVKIGPSGIVLVNSSILTGALSNAASGGTINIAGRPLFSVDSTIKGIGPVIVAGAPTTDVAGSLVPLDAQLTIAAVALVPSCGMHAGQDQSSFTLEGGNGLPADPGLNSPSAPIPTTRPVEGR